MRLLSVMEVFTVKDPGEVDARLVAAHLDGDPVALAMLVERHRARLMGFLVRRVGGDAEDLSQEVWSRVARGLPSWRADGHFRAWLFQIARHLVIDHQRREKARPKLVSQEAPVRLDLSDPEARLTALQTARVVEDALDRMPAQVAAVVRLRLGEGVPFKEIARRQGVPLNTALGRMHRGLRALREALLEQAGSRP